eukprot:TRINITY_DN24733_c0_g1_i2.p2 TRINITY_DN24733_c0_g1~~TRINITY_DN24733_c0_g1_i2.p2  ORF type:complete len:108 (-),score=34.92 TRINITY_DN24733_c0_g1_i2:122-445(-)
MFSAITDGLDSAMAGAANTLQATSTLEASVQMGLSPMELETLGGWITLLKEKGYDGDAINAIARTWSAKPDSGVEEYYRPAWSLFKQRTEAMAVSYTHLTLPTKRIV